MKSIVVKQKQSEAGFTLIELIIAIAITGIIMGAAATGVYQLIAGNAANSHYMTAVRQVQQVGHWISKDMLMADPAFIDYLRTDDLLTTPDPDLTTDVLTVYWTEFVEWYDGGEGVGIVINSIKNKVTYSIDDYGSMRRYHMSTVEAEHYEGYPEINDVAWVQTIGNPLLIAQHIDLDSFNIILDSGKYRLTVVAEVPGFQPATKTRNYDIEPRLG